MLTDDEIKKLLAHKCERPDLDYKEGFAWTKDNRDKKYELIRDLMGMANTKDGGRIILGVRDGDFEFIGLPDDLYNSIDPNNIVQTAHDNSAPKLNCEVIKRLIDGKKVVVLDVAEFDKSTSFKDD
jgi:predicted HTH transcriptional regulator